MPRMRYSLRRTGSERKVLATEPPCVVLERVEIHMPGKEYLVAGYACNDNNLAVVRHGVNECNNVSTIMEENRRTKPDGRRRARTIRKRHGRPEGGAG